MTGVPVAAYRVDRPDLQLVKRIPADWTSLLKGGLVESISIGELECAFVIADNRKTGYFLLACVGECRQPQIAIKRSNDNIDLVGLHELPQLIHNESRVARSFILPYDLEGLAGHLASSLVKGKLETVD